MTWSRRWTGGSTSHPLYTIVNSEKGRRLNSTIKKKTLSSHDKFSFLTIVGFIFLSCFSSDESSYQNYWTEKKWEKSVLLCSNLHSQTKSDVEVERRSGMGTSSATWVVSKDLEKANQILMKKEQEMKAEFWS